MPGKSDGKKKILGECYHALDNKNSVHLSGKDFRRCDCRNSIVRISSKYNGRRDRKFDVFFREGCLVAAHIEKLIKNQSINIIDFFVHIVHITEAETGSSQKMLYGNIFRTNEKRNSENISQLFL